MKRLCCLLLFLYLLPSTSHAQVLPNENSSLNYRLIGFSFPAVAAANKYKIEIAQGTYNSADSFTKNVIKSVTTKDTKVITDVPLWGKSYTWRVVANKNNNTGETELHHFTTLSIPGVDTSVTRLRVLQQAKKYKDAYVFLDGNRALYDMQGNAVWYLPDIDGLQTDRSVLRDMKLTSRGTITFMYEERGAYEVNYNGDIIWKAPNDGKVGGGNAEFYHHQLTRLPNGHYMILGIESELWNKQLPSADSSFKIFPLANSHVADSNKRKYEKVPFGTIIEYDDQGNVVWSWKSSDYFRNSDIYYKQGRNSQPDITAHENSFYFDEAAQVIYLGFRNISRILKIQYPSGKVLDAYGETFGPGKAETGNGLYCRQHSVRRSENGYLYLYNNNSCDNGGLPQLLKLEEPATPGAGLKKIWEYDCTTEGIMPGQQATLQFSVGGNVVELPDQCLLANMSTSYSKVFILSPDKKILWSAIPEKWNPRFKRWDMIYQYRTSMISGSTQLASLIWNTAVKK